MSKIQSLIEKGTQLLEDAKYDEALEYLDKALSLDPKNTHAWNQKGVALRSLGRYDEAIECFNRALEIIPKDLDAS
jgi:tetratricopeptide (TPR) repeat protein